MSSLPDCTALTRQEIEKAKAKRQREKKSLKRLKSWLKLSGKLEVSQGKKALPISSLKKKIVEGGVPPSLRTRIWPYLIGNSSKITPQLFKVLLEKVSSDDECTKQIELDLPRTFAAITDLPRDSLRRILQAYSVFRPDIGYVQGQSFLAAVFLLYLDETTAFSCFANTLHRHFYFDAYQIRLETPKLQLHLKAFDVAFSRRHPKLHSHFNSLAVTPDMYVLQWWLALFSRAISNNFEVVARIWDNYFCLGELFIFRASLGILRMFEEQLLLLDFAELLKFLSRLPPTLDETKLFSNINAVKLAQKQMDRLLEAARQDCCDVSLRMTPPPPSASSPSSSSMVVVAAEDEEEEGEPRFEFSSWISSTG